MKLIDIPAKFPIPFASSAGAGFTRPIPVPPQTGGAASLTDGFPEPTFLQVGSGGIPPDGRDFNGLLNQITAWSRWLNAGGLVRYDAVFSAAIGGYPVGSLLSSADVPGLLWISTIDDNLIDPDAGLPTNAWLAVGSTSATKMFVGAGAVSVLDGDEYIGLKLSGSATVTLPTAVRAGRKLVFQDLLYNMFTNKLVMSPGVGQNIGGRVGAFTMNQNGQTAELTMYEDGLTWGLST